LYLIVYLVEKWPKFIKEVPSVVQVATNVSRMVDSTMEGFQQRAKE